MEGYLTTRQLAKATGIPEHAVRVMVKTGNATGFYIGNRFYHNVSAFKAKLAQMSAEQANIPTQATAQ